MLDQRGEDSYNSPRGMSNILYYLFLDFAWGEDMRINNKYRDAFLCFCIVLLAGFALPALAAAAVAGPCTNCHTMHNSQDGTNMVYIGANAGWDAGDLTATASSATAQNNLLISDCVGCHSSPGLATIIEMGGAGSGFRVPIVWNIGGGQLPSEELAGGNFSHVAADSGKGHNVKGISPAADGTLSAAPGFLAGKGCAESCHASLFDDVTPAGTPPSGVNQTGCQGCHLHVGHHAPPDDGGPGAAYRFLGGHGGGIGTVPNGTGAGYEGADWGRPGTEANIYLGQSTLNVQQLDPLPIGRFCAGCHNAFHAVGVIDDMLGEDNKGDRNATPNDGGTWLRHPTNVDIGGVGEFAGLIGLGYNTGSILLARTGFMNRGVVTASDQVMCLSCHKAHGSEYQDALRFSYSTVSAHSGAGNTTNGCFYCHRTKDI